MAAAKGAQKSPAKKRGKPARQQAAEEQVETPPVPETPDQVADSGQQEAPDGILVTLKQGAGLETQVTPLGQVRVTEIETLLQLALRDIRKDLGYGA